MQNYKKKTMLFGSLVLSMSFIVSSFSNIAFANETKNLSYESYELNLSDEDYAQLESYFSKMKPVSDDEVGNYLIENGYVTRDELNKIDNEYYAQLENDDLNHISQLNTDASTLFAKSVYINGYNKYRTFTKNGKQHLYVYISGTNLNRIKKGIPFAAILSAELPHWVLRVVAGITIVGINNLIERTGTRYDIVLKYIKDKWVHLGATYTYRSNGWFYQT